MRNTAVYTSGHDALARRDALDKFITHRLPGFIKPLVSELFTRITGLAPTSSGGQPIWRGSIRRAFGYMLGTLFLGALGVFLGSARGQVAGGLVLVSAMRYFTSGLGHHLTHSSKGLPWPHAWTRGAYDVLSALLLLTSYQEYQVEHGHHHAKVAGPEDPDQRFIQHLKARLSGIFPLLQTLFSPTFHARFLLARLRASIMRGPVWRRTVAVAGLVGMLTLPAATLSIWLAILVAGYQIASLLSFVSLHLWDQRPASGKPFEIATAVTFGRLLIPEATIAGILKLPIYALARILWLQGDLNNHDLHHIGTGPWTEAPYVRTRLLLEGAAIEQTNGLRAMFVAAFVKNEMPIVGKREEPSDESLLGM